MDLELNILGQNGGCGGSGRSGSCSESGGCQGCSGASDATSRRGFLEQATSIALGSFSLTLLPVSLAALGKSDSGPNGAATDPAAADVQPALFGFLIDTEKCAGLGKCLTACRTENNVPEGVARTWVERYVHFKDGRVQVDLVPETGYNGSDLPEIPADDVERAYFVPKLCNQCEDAPCMQVCPVHASIKSPEGLQLIDNDLCIGCAYCVQACPYGIRFINPETNNADKCTWCYHRIMNKEQPACVEACPTGARVFGRLDDPNSEISQRLAKVPTHVLKEHLGTYPRLQYIGISSEVI